MLTGAGVPGDLIVRAQMDAFVNIDLAVLKSKG